ncbi:hypothetical protein [Methyloversatilis thermotolerans]|uniref:hypothetical protein n=1 Tax=Methyloversatilis thermotolerans TaxID=1346290 RepID=UPI001E53B1A4|nr:hypothetical protein [Methyloversatilis thermotolerans]
MPSALAAQAAPFDDFLARLRAAAAARDVVAVAGLSRLPFLYEERLLDRNALIRALPGLMDERVARCLASAPPLREGADRLLYRAPYTFHLRAGADGQWRLEEFSADGEDLP